MGKLGSKKPLKMAQIMDVPLPQKLLKIYNLRTTNAMKMKLTTIVCLHETFHSWGQKIWPLPIGCGRVCPKELWKNKKKNIGFLAPFFGIFRTVSETVTYVILCLALHHWWKVCTNLIWFGVVIYEKPTKSSQKSYSLIVQEPLKISDTEH